MSNEETRTVVLDSFPIELCQLLKLENLAETGGEAKHVIAEGHVLYNGEVETRKRKKVFAGDVVVYGGVTLRIEAAQASGATE